MSGKVIRLHIGAPKTGTTYVQDRLTRNAAALAARGVLVPTQNRFVPADLFHFRAALDVLGQDWGGPPGHAEGAWDTMLQRIDRAKADVIVISHEILGAAKPEHVERVRRDLAGHDLHIVFSARDLARQVPAAWQESIKQGRTWTYKRFTKRVIKGNAWFWHAFDLPTILETWGAGLPSDHIHLVTVPQSGAPRDLLWLRMCQALAVDPDWAPAPSERRNASLGAPETAVLRALNRRIKREARRDPRYDEFVLELLGHQALAGRPTPAVRLRPSRYDWAERRAEEWIAWATERGVDVIGDLDELRPVRPVDDDWINPDRVGNKMKYRAALTALAAMTEEAASRPRPDSGRVARLRTGLDRLRSR